MSDKAKIAEPLSDAAIETFVVLVRAAEQLAAALDISASEAMRQMLVTHNAMVSAQAGQAFDALRAMPTAKKVQ